MPGDRRRGLIFQRPTKCLLLTWSKDGCLINMHIIENMGSSLRFEHTMRFDLTAISFDFENVQELTFVTDLRFYTGRICATSNRTASSRFYVMIKSDGEHHHAIQGSCCAVSTNVCSIDNRVMG